MKKTVIMCSLFLIFSTAVLGVGFIGTPTAELRKGQWSTGFNYSYFGQNTDKKTITRKTVYYEYDYFHGVSETTDLGAVLYKFKLEDFNTQRHYGILSYGITDWWEVYGQLGIADIKTDIKGYYESDSWELGRDFDNDFAWGWGTKITLARQDKISWGTVLQMNFLDTRWNTKGIREGLGPDQIWKYETDIKTYDLLVAAGPTIDMGGWKLYGGPFYYYLSGNYNTKDTMSSRVGAYAGEPYWDVWGVWISKDHGDIQNDYLGGYIGAQFDFARNWSTNMEFSSAGDTWGLGASIVYKF